MRDLFTCKYCGRAMNPLSDDLTLDHVHPDGNSTEENLVTACVECNSRKGIRKAEEFKAMVLKESRERIGFNTGGPMASGMPSPISLEEILLKTSEFSKIPPAEIRTRNNQRRFVEARTVFSVIARRAGYSLPAIGKFLGKHHSTVLHMLENIAPKVTNCPQSIFTPQGFSDQSTTTSSKENNGMNLVSQ